MLYPISDGKRVKASVGDAWLKSEVRSTRVRAAPMLEGAGSAQRRGKGSKARDVLPENEHKGTSYTEIH